MGTIIICVLIGISIGIYTNFKKEKCLSDRLIKGVGIGGGFGFIIGFFIMLLLPMDTTMNTYEYDIVSPSSMEYVEGESVIFFGEINNQKKYEFYYNTDDGIKFIQLNAINTILKYSDKPKLVIRKEEPTTAMINHFAGGFSSLFIKQYILYIPKGTLL